MTLGHLIALLEALDDERETVGLGELESYRGYYCDLAFEPSGDLESVESLLARCRAAMGREFTGYKGGEFLMGAPTPLWIAPYGVAGASRLMGLDTGADPITPTTKEE